MSTSERLQIRLRRGAKWYRTHALHEPLEHEKQATRSRLLAHSAACIRCGNAAKELSDFSRKSKRCVSAMISFQRARVSQTDDPRSIRDASVWVRLHIARHTVVYKNQHACPYQKDAKARWH